MIDLGSLGDLATSGVTGGLVGLGGSIVSSITKGLTKRQENKHSLAMREADLKEVREEAASAEKRIALELEGRRDESAQETRRASYVEAATSWTAGMDLPEWLKVFPVGVDTVRGLARPLLTCYLVHTSAPHLTPAVWAFLTSTAVTWWFGDRAIAAGGSLTKKLTA